MADQPKPTIKRHAKVFPIIAIVLIAALAGGYYYLSIPRLPAKFTLAVASSAFPLSPGWGRNLTVGVSRTTGFAADVHVGLANGPNWVYFAPTVIRGSTTNATMFITINKTAPKGPVDLNVKAVGEGSADQSVTVSMRVVGVLNVTESVGSAEVYETTKVLDDATMKSLTSYDKTSGVIQFSQATQTLQSLQVGDVVVGPPSISTMARNGFVRTVLSIQRTSGVTLATERATLLEMFRTVHIGGPSSSGSSGSIGVSSHSFRPATDFPVIPSTTFSDTENLGGGYNMGVSLTVEVHIFFGIDMDQGVQDACVVAAAASGPLSGIACVLVASETGNVDFFATTLQGHEEADAWLKGPGGNIQWSKPNLIHIFGPVSIPIFPPFVWMDLNGDIEATLGGHLEQTDVEAKATFDFSFGPVYKSCNYGCGGWQLDHDANPGFDKKVQLGFANGDHLRGELGPRMDADLDGGIVGGNIAVHIFLELTEQIPHNPTAWLDGGVDLTEGFDVFWGAYSLSFGPQDIVRINIWNAPDQPPEAPTINIPSRTLDFTQGLLNPANFQWTATVTEPEGDNVCGGQGSVVWYSSVEGQVGTGCSMDASAVKWKSAGQRDVWAVAFDSGNNKSPDSNHITVTVILPSATVEIISAPTGESGQPSNTLFQGVTYSFQAQAYVAYGAYHQPLDCNVIVWGVSFASNYNNWYVVGHGCFLNYAPQNTGDLKVEAVASYNGVDSSSKMLTYHVVAKPSSYNYGPSIKITSPTGGTVYPPSAGLTASIVEPEGESIKNVVWSAKWCTTTNVCHTYPVSPGTTSVKASFVKPPQGTAYDVSGTWDITQWCQSAQKDGFGNAQTVSLTLNAMDSAGIPGQPNTVSINLQCAVVQSLPLTLGEALATLLALPLTVAAERKKIIAELKPWVIGI